MLIKRNANERGLSKTEWLTSFHSFSFGDYFDENHLGFSDLLVINDDIIKPRSGFNTHAHRDMEIFTYVLEGTLTHKDSINTNSATIEKGEIQLMSAGSGIRHSEYNHDLTKAVHLLQIWLRPNQNNLQPGYQQIALSNSALENNFQLIISPTGEKNSLLIHQDAFIYAGIFNQTPHTHKLEKSRFYYIHLARGKLDLNDMNLSEGDGVMITEEDSLTITNSHSAEILLFDLRQI
jgi:redox-sensitive bicupin YhaK (pirin superfamily)